MKPIDKFVEHPDFVKELGKYKMSAQEWGILADVSEVLQAPSFER